MSDQRTQLTGMFRVLEIRGPLLKLAWWDRHDQEIDHVFIGEVNEPSLEIGSMHMMHLMLSGGLLKVQLCSPAYDECDIDFEEDIEEDLPAQIIPDPRH